MLHNFKFSLRDDDLNCVSKYCEDEETCRSISRHFMRNPPLDVLVSFDVMFMLIIMQSKHDFLLPPHIILYYVS
jgi:hypothetical protein